MSNRPVDFERIHDALSFTRSRLRGRALVQTLLWSAGGLGAGFLALVALAAGLSGGRSFRLFAWTLFALGAGALLWRFLWRPWRRAGDDAAVAGHLERGLPDLKDGLIASVQFAREWDAPGQQTPELVAGLARQVEHRLSEVDLASQTPLLPSKRPLHVALGVAALWLLLGLVGPAWLTRGLGTLLPARTAEGARLVGPLVGDLELTLIYPPYMKRSDRVVPNSTGDFEAPKGTVVQVRATTLAAARALAIVQPGAGPDGAAVETPLMLADARDGTGRWTITTGGKWRFVVVSEDGETQAEAIERQLRLEPDQPPSVTLKLPAADGEITDLRPIRVEFEGGDDHGLSKAAILLTLEADPDHPERIDQPGVSGKRIDGGDEIDLARIQATGGDRIGISVELYDNNGVDGPQRSVSAMRWLTIHSPQKKHQEEMEKLNGLVDAFVNALADRLEIDYRADADPATKAALAPVTERVLAYFNATESAAKTLAEIVARLKDDALTPKEVQLALAGRTGSLEKALGAEKPVVTVQTQGLAGKQDAAIRAVSRANEATIEQVEQTIVLIEALVARLALEELMALTDEIKASTQRLRDLIGEYKRAPSDALKQRIRRDIQRLKSRIEEIRERIAKLRQKLPEEFLNMDGLKNDEVQKGLEKTESQLDQIDKMLEENRLDDALKAIEEMEQSLEELSKQLDEDLDDLNEESNPEMQKAISELMDQTRDLMQQQQGLNDETNAALKEEDDCIARILGETLAAPYGSLKERGGRLRGLIERVDPVDLPPYMQSELDEARGRIDQYNDALTRPELVDAMEMGERLVDSLETMERAIRMAGTEPSAATHDALAQGKALGREVARDTAALLKQFDVIKRRECEPKPPPMAGPTMPDPQGQPQPGETGEPQPQPGQQGGPPQNQGQRQRQVAEGARRLRDRIGQSGERIPGMSPEMGQKAGNAAQAMDKAAEGLDRQRPGEARPSQRQAMNELEGIMQGLKQAASPQRADRGQGERDGEGRRMSRRKVEIPGADAHESPAEFRKDLLDAMKDKAPEAFEEQVKRYYETLVE